MPIRSDDPLRKVTLNLYEADVEWLISAYGHGWTERIRQHIHDEVTERQMRSQPDPIATMNRLMTLGDLDE
jgi:hypothetical protein